MQQLLPEWTFTPAVIGRTLRAMDVYEIRWQNFRALAGHPGGITEAADRLGKLQGQVSHFGGERPIKNIGPKIARQIEKAYGKPHGWLDAVHGDEQASVHASQSTGPDPAILYEALSLMTFDEMCAGAYTPRAYSDRLADLYRRVAADGGKLTTAHNADFEREVRARSQQGEGKDEGVKTVRRQAARRRAS